MLTISGSVSYNRLLYRDRGIGPRLAEKDMKNEDELRNTYY